MKWLHECNARGLRIVGQGANVRTWFSFSLDLWNLYDYSPSWNFATQGTTAEKIAKFSDLELRKKL